MKNGAQRAVAFDPDDLSGTIENAVVTPLARPPGGDRPTAADWQRVKLRLKAELGDDVFSSWFASLEFDHAQEALVFLSAPTKFLKSWIQSHYADRILELWARERPGVRRVEIAVRSPVRARQTPEAAAEPYGTVASPSVTEPREVPTLLPGARTAPTVARRNPEPRPDPFGGSALDPRQSFASFCEGVANRVAFAAARSVAEVEPGRPAPFNPLFLHAGVGRGKTHLLHAIAQAASQAWPGRKVVYLTAEHFMFRFVAALRSQSAIPFKESLREIDLLLIDDIQFLQGKQVQTEFCHTLNLLVDGARQVVVAADRPPAELETLDERMRSRLGGGVAIEIGTPDLDLRRSILQSRYAAAHALHPGLDIPPAILEYVAQSVVSNGRDLEGALNRLVAQWQFTNAAVTMTSAEVTLRDLIGLREPRRVRIEDIQKAVSKHFNVSKADLLSSRRTRTIVRPRQIAMYLAKMLTPRSLPEIGRRFGGRDHTTVLHAVRKVEELMRDDRNLAEEVELLKRVIDE